MNAADVYPADDGETYLFVKGPGGGVQWVPLNMKPLTRLVDEYLEANSLPPAAEMADRFRRCIEDEPSLTFLVGLTGDTPQSFAESFAEGLTQDRTIPKATGTDPHLADRIGEVPGGHRETAA